MTTHETIIEFTEDFEPVDPRLIQSITLNGQRFVPESPPLKALPVFQVGDIVRVASRSPLVNDVYAPSSECANRLGVVRTIDGEKIGVEFPRVTSGHRLRGVLNSLSGQFLSASSLTLAE